MNAKDLLAESDLTNPDIKGIVSENKFRVNELEIYSKQLAENIHLTNKTTKG